ncbi:MULTISPECIES: TetR/AcrR family transcriptional regulator [Alteromonas]|uniref:TetR/AcrR family transcriptional regulator n=1 Tax=Alteromonas TaxID=226 RepID=UPI000AB6CD5C|nr:MULTISPECIES: TetR/AcrR family transcriptional regulator [Alteromonas]QPL49701.1 TetR/AcrR family transcriptional regulator [Alteromonas sp. B31-7]
MTEPRRQGRPKSEEKRQDILRAASTLFLKEGFANTSMDSVAKASGVSKQTVYSHFSSKDSLFKAAIGSKCRSYQLDALQIEDDAKAQPMPKYLTKVGTQFIKLLQDPDAIALFRVIIAEGGNNPRAAQLFYQAGPLATLDTLGAAFKRYGSPTLSTELAHKLAFDFCALLKGEFHTMLLCGLRQPMTDSEISAHVAPAVEKITTLFRAYCTK